MESLSFARFAGACALAAAAAGFAYSLAFTIYLHDGSRGAAYVDAILLLAGGVLSTAVFSALYLRLRQSPAIRLEG